MGTSRRTPHTPSPTVTEQEGARGRRHVRIVGNLPVGWLGSLSLGLAEAGLSIERGRAHRGDRQPWEIDLELDARGRDRRLAPADYLLLACRRLPAAPLPIVIDDHRIERDRRTLVLDVKGQDCVGFLGSLLDRLAGLLLFPVALEIETVGFHAVDRLRLQALGGTEPSAEVERRLASLLDALRPAPAFGRWSPRSRSDGADDWRRARASRPTGMSPRADEDPTFVSLAPRLRRERGLDC